MPTTTVEAFSISAAAILTPTGSQGAQFWGVREGRIEIEANASDLREDDWIIGSWTDIRTVTITVTSGYLSFDALAYITSRNATTSSGAPDNYYAYPLSPQYDANTRPVPVAIRCPAKDSNGSSGTLDLILYSVYLGPVEPAGITYKSGMSCSFTGKAVPSWRNDFGQLLSERAFGRVVSWQNAKASFTGVIGNYYLVTSRDTAAATDAHKTSANAFRATLASSDTAKASPETERLTRTTVTSTAYPETATGTEGTSLRVATSDSDSAAASDGASWWRWSSPNAQLTGSATIAATPRMARRGAMTSIGYGQLDARCTVIPAVAAPQTINATSTVTGTGTMVTLTRMPATATLSGSAAISANPKVRVPGTASLSGSATLAAQSQTGGGSTITNDPSTPNPTTFINSVPVLTCTSSPFSPPAGSLVVVGAVWLWLSSTTDTSLTCADSLSNGYTRKVFMASSPYYATLGIFYRYYSSAPGSITVTVTTDHSGTSSVLLAPRVLTGCASTQTSGATASNASSGQVTATTTQDGSRVFVVTGRQGQATNAGVNGTVTIRDWQDAWTFNEAAIGYLDTDVHGSCTAGFDAMARGIAWEILHA